MPSDVFSKYLSEINKAYLRGDATEHTNRPALKALIEGLGKKITATNELGMELESQKVSFHVVDESEWQQRFNELLSI